MPKKGYYEIDIDGEPEGESAYPDSEYRKEVVTCVCPGAENEQEKEAISW